MEIFIQNEGFLCLISRINNVYQMKYFSVSITDAMTNKILIIILPQELREH